MHTRFPFVPRRGFTLVELLVVMAVMAVIAGIGVFAIAPFQSRSSVNGGAALVQSVVDGMADEHRTGQRARRGADHEHDRGHDLPAIGDEHGPRAAQHLASAPPVQAILGSDGATEPHG